MKKTIIVVALLIALSSCKKCYVCTTNVELYDTWGGKYNEYSSDANFCGTPYEKKKHEKEGTKTVAGYNKAKTVTVITCVAE